MFTPAPLTVDGVFKKLKQVSAAAGGSVSSRYDACAWTKSFLRVFIRQAVLLGHRSDGQSELEMYMAWNRGGQLIWLGGHFVRPRSAEGHTF